jgi:hypothetical protein
MPEVSFDTIMMENVKLATFELNDLILRVKCLQTDRAFRNLIEKYGPEWEVLYRIYQFVVSLP